MCPANAAPNVVIRSYVEIWESLVNLGANDKMLERVNACAHYLGMKIIHFPRWAEVLDACDLSRQEREGFRVTLRWYLSWCAKQRVGCSVESARGFIEWAEGEKQPKEWVLERWKDALRWFFVAAKAHAGANSSVDGGACDERTGPVAITGAKSSSQFEAATGISDGSSAADAGTVDQ